MRFENGCLHCVERCCSFSQYSCSLDPIWTVKTGSLFLLTLTVEELFTSNGLICEVMDFDKFGGNDKLGLITVPPKVLYDAKGERLEFNLVSTRNSMEASVSLLGERASCCYDEVFGKFASLTLSFRLTGRHRHSMSTRH